MEYCERVLHHNHQLPPNQFNRHAPRRRDTLLCWLVNDSDHLSEHVDPNWCAPVLPVLRTQTVVQASQAQIEFYQTEVEIQVGVEAEEEEKGEGAWGKGG